MEETVAVLLDESALVRGGADQGVLCRCFAASKESDRAGVA